MNRKIEVLVFAIFCFILSSCAPASRPFEDFGANVEKPDIIPQPPPEIPDPKFSIQGHRGARAIYPQNTLPSFDYALSVNADQIEFDTQFTSDNIIVINHDAYIDATRCQTRDGKKIPKKKLFIRNMTLEQVKQYDCGSLQVGGVPKYTTPGEKIPTLDELIQFVLNSKHPNAQVVGFKFDIKYDPKTPQYFPKPAEIAKQILDKVKYYGIQNRSQFSAFEPRILEELYKIDSGLKLAYLVGLGVGQAELELALSLHVMTFSPHLAGLKLHGVKKWTDRFHAKGIRVIPYTVNKQSDWKKFLNAGVDGIITDDPEGLRAYYETRKPTEWRSDDSSDESDVETSEDGMVIPEEEL